MHDLFQYALRIRSSKLSIPQRNYVAALTDDQSTGNLTIEQYLFRANKMLQREADH